MIPLFIPFLFILISLGVITGMIMRKFPQLSLLDVENIPEVKEGKKKEVILKHRVEKHAEDAKKVRAIRWKPVMQKLKAWQLAFRTYVGRLERRIRHAAMPEKKKAQVPPSSIEDMEHVRVFLADAAGAMARGDLEAAEKKYISAIRLDPKQKDAYRGLGDVYAAQGHVREAKETYAFAARLDPADDAVFMKLSALAEAEGDATAAVEYLQRAVLLNDNLSGRFAKLAELLSILNQYPTALEAAKQAVDLEPQNPKYLDMLAEIAILTGDKALASEAVQALRMVNPENQKLSMLKDTIDKMPS